MDRSKKLCLAEDSKFVAKSFTRCFCTSNTILVIVRTSLQTTLHTVFLTGGPVTLLSPGFLGRSPECHLHMRAWLQDQKRWVNLCEQTPLDPLFVVLILLAIPTNTKVKSQGKGAGEIDHEQCRGAWRSTSLSFLEVVLQSDDRTSPHKRHYKWQMSALRWCVDRQGAKAVRCSSGVLEKTFVIARRTQSPVLCVLYSTRKEDQCRGITNCQCCQVCPN